MKIKLIFADSLANLETNVNTFLESGVSAVSSVDVFKQDSFIVAAITYTES